MNKGFVCLILLSLCLLSSKSFSKQSINPSNQVNGSMPLTKIEFPFFDDFENGLGNWLVSGTDWDTISDTCINPPGHSITESPDGNYPAHSNATITLASPVDLSSSVKPVLSYWHRIVTHGNNDFCYVEISVDGGINWTELSKDSGRRKSFVPCTFDLSAYKTSPVLIRFRLRSNATVSYDGWYIDNVSIQEHDTTLTPFPFTDDFEKGLGNWLASGMDWDTISDTCVGAPGHSVTESPVGNYLPLSNATLTLAHPIDISSATKPVLSYWHRIVTHGNNDFCYVEISVDGGVTWTELSKDSGRRKSFVPCTIDLSAYKASPVLIRFRLRSNATVFYDGWYLDNVSIHELDTTLMPFPFKDDFENGLDNWLVSGMDWDTVSDPCVNPPGHSVTESPVGNYLPFSNTTMTLAHPIDLSAINSPVLSFWHRHTTHGNNDFCYSEISEDGGVSWTELKKYSGNITTFVLEKISLSAYKTSPVLVRFRLRDKGTVFYDGWYIDDVEINDPTGIFHKPDENVINFSLNYIHVNPSNNMVSIYYTISKPGLITLKLYDLMGKEIKTLFSKSQNPGTYMKQCKSDELSSGVYIYRLRSKEKDLTKRVCITK